MAKKDYSPDIRALESSLSYYAKNQDQLSPGDLNILNKAFSVYSSYCDSLLGYEVDSRIIDLSSFQRYVKPSEIGDLISKLTDLNNEKEEKEKEKTAEKGSSIPPELESLVAEYQQNKALLESEEIKSNAQKSVAEQVNIAIAHSKRNELIIANKERRQSQGEKFQDVDEVFVSLGSPKSQSKTAALKNSYAAVKQVAFTYSGFGKLPPELQNNIISYAVELNTIGVSDIDTAIQASTLKIDSSNLEDFVKNNLATIPGGFISTVYQEVITQDQKTKGFEAKISANEETVLKLQKQGKTKEAQELIEENQHLQAFNEGQSTRLTNQIAKQTELFKDFENSRKIRLSKDPDLVDTIELANNTVDSINNNLINNNVRPHLPTSMDQADLIEKAIRQDMPGVLNTHAGYNAEYAAALINNPKTQDPNLSPQAILMAGMGLTPNVLTSAREFAIKNPESSLGKLYKTRKDIFDSAGVQIRKIAGSPLGKEISAKTGLEKIFSSPSKFLGKISDKIPGGFGGALRIIQNPLGSLQSWAGKKAGQYFLKQISQRVAGETLKKTAEFLINGGIKKAVAGLTAKVVAKATAWIATKLAISATLESLNAVAPGVGFLIDLVVQAVLWIAEKTIGYVKKVIDNVSESIYGERIKARDLLALPVAGATATIVGVSAVVVTLSTATYIAAKSALSTIFIGTLAGIFFYITSIVMAPLISTLVQLETRPSTAIGCASWPTAGEYILTQGPLGTFSHSLNSLQAVDIAAEANTGFLAAAPGKVTFSGVLGSYGNTVFVEAITDIGTITMLYAHMNDIAVSIGQNVEVGDTIGSVGGTGGWTPHIHFEYLNGTEYNSCPAGDIPVPEGCVGSTCLYNGQLIYSNLTTP